MRVFNFGNTSIAEIRWKDCGSPEQSFQAIPQSSILPMQSFAIPLFNRCADFIAVNAAGQIAGRQFDLRMEPGTSWEIR